MKLTVDLRECGWQWRLWFRWNQKRFCFGRRLADWLHTSERLRVAHPIHVCLVDLEKAIDLASRGVLWEVLWEKGFLGPPPKLTWKDVDLNPFLFSLENLSLSTILAFKNSLLWSNWQKRKTKLGFRRWTKVDLDLCPAFSVSSSFCRKRAVTHVCVWLSLLTDVWLMDKKGRQWPTSGSYDTVTFVKTQTLWDFSWSKQKML